MKIEVGAFHTLRTVVFVVNNRADKKLFCMVQLKIRMGITMFMTMEWT